MLLRGDAPKYLVATAELHITRLHVTKTARQTHTVVMAVQRNHLKGECHGLANPERHQSDELRQHGPRTPCIGCHELVNPESRPSGNSQIGRASCRDRGCNYVETSVVVVTLKKKKIEK